MKPWKIVVIAGAAIVTLAILVGGAFFAVGVYGYNHVSYDYEVGELEPVANTSTENILAALLLYSSGDIEGAVSSILESIEVNGSFIVTNNSFTSLYIPEFSHAIVIAGVVVCDDIITEPTWVDSGAEKVLEISCEIDESVFGDLLSSLMSDIGESIEVSIESKASFGPFNFDESAQKQLEPGDFTSYFDYPF